MMQTISRPEMDIAWTRFPGELAAVHAQVSSLQLVDVCRHVRDHGGRLVSLWVEDARASIGAFRLCVVLESSRQLLVLEHALAPEATLYPDLSAIFPSAARLQRAAHDLLGVRALGGDERPWLRHSAWRDDVFPLRADAPAEPVATNIGEPYRFVRVEGEGVHEIAVGPVHAGTIEPGHFRFSVVGEKVLRLEQRLGYVHKGIEKRFEGMPVSEGGRLAARVSGDSAVAFAWAYAMAAEATTSTQISPRAAAVRALLLERERLANHLGDLGALGNDAGLAFGLTQFSRLKEDLLRDNARVWGVRYPMDAVVPGGVLVDVSPAAARTLLDSSAILEAEVRNLRSIYDDHSGLQDRFMGAGCVTPDLGRQLGITGLAARASGQAHDWRSDLPVAPYDTLAAIAAVRMQGDVAARVAVRFDEIAESLRLCRVLLAALPSGTLCVPLGIARDGALGLGGVESWRGPVLVALRVAGDGRIVRCHPHDPSWHNWPALEFAAYDNIVPDFPLINKSFNLSYSGHDL